MFSLKKIPIHDSSRVHWLYFRRGIKDGAATLVATGIWGFVTGIAMMKSDLGSSYAALMTLFVYAGSAQLTSLPLINMQAPLWLIFMAGMVVNLRFLIFAAALQPHFRHLHWFKRLMLGYITTDMVFVVFMARNPYVKTVGRAQRVWYFVGIAAASWVIWQCCSYLGIVAGQFIPSSWGIEYAAILALTAVLLPLLKSRPMVMCLVVAGVVAWVGQLLPLRLGLAAAVIAGVVAGVVAEQLQHKRSA